MAQARRIPDGHRRAPGRRIGGGAPAPVAARSSCRDCALILALAVPRLRRLDLGLLLFVVVASHGVLDSFTDGGLGIAFLWPFTNERFFSPWRPIPVAPIGSRLFGASGLWVMMVELLIFLPLLPLAFWPRREGRA